MFQAARQRENPRGIGGSAKRGNVCATKAHGGAYVVGE